MNISEISKLLKRKYPFLLLDGVTHIEPEVMCNAYKNLTYNEWFFPVHFPDNPIMPGTLQLEAFSQAVALPLLIMPSIKDVLLANIDKVRFYKSIIPGDRFEICAKIERIVNDVAVTNAIGSVNNEIVSECKIMYKIIREKE